MFQPGQQIGGYTLIAKLGSGGFGVVWLAEKRSAFVSKKVAVKLPHEDQVNFNAIRQEATLWEQASGHPNVLPIIDADIFDGQVLIVSEYADGGSLADKLKRDGMLPVKEAVEMVIGTLNGLEFLHGKEIIHRDIKPANILLQGGTPRLADFGISRAMQTTAVSSAIIGTDSYMAPEAFDGKRNVQTDIWSVGVLLYQLLKGSLPFPQEHPSERMFAVLTKEFEPLGESVPSDLRQIVQRALAKLPEYRYQSAGEMRFDLQKALVAIAHPTIAKIGVIGRTTFPVPANEPRIVEGSDKTLEVPESVTGKAPDTLESIDTNYNEVQTIVRPAAVSPNTAAQQSFVTQLKPPNGMQTLPSGRIVKKKTPAYLAAGLVAAILGLFLLVGAVFLMRRVVREYSASEANKTRPVSVNSNGQAPKNTNAAPSTNSSDQAAELIKTIDNTKGTVSQLSFSLDGTRLLGSFDGNKIAMWNSASGFQAFTIDSDFSELTDLALSPDGKIIGGGGYQKSNVRLWDAEKGKLLHTLTGHGAEVMGIAFSPDSKLIASGSRDYMLRVFDVTTGEKVQQIRGPEAACVSFGAGGKTVAGDYGDKLIIFDVATGKEARRIKVNSTGVCPVLFSPDGSVIASDSDSKIKLWNPDTGVELQSFPNFSVFAFSRDSKTLAGAVGDVVKLYDVSTGREKGQIKTNSTSLYSVTFSADGKTLATSGQDRAIKIWRLK